MATLAPPADPLPETRLRVSAVLTWPRLQPFAAEVADSVWKNSYRYDETASGSIYFLTRDPLVGRTLQPYAYVAGNPLNSTDPAGMCMVGSAACPDSTPAYPTPCQSPSPQLTGFSPFSGKFGAGVVTTGPGGAFRVTAHFNYNVKLVVWVASQPGSGAIAEDMWPPILQSNGFPPSMVLSEGELIVGTQDYQSGLYHFDPSKGPVDFQLRALAVDPKIGAGFVWSDPMQFTLQP